MKDRQEFLIKWLMKWDIHFRLGRWHVILEIYEMNL